MKTEKIMQHLLGKTYKEIVQAHTLAALQTDERVAKALIGRYENYEEFQS